jgi:hypothetical protein
MTTDAQPITLTVFLLARITEDEAVARETAVEWERVPWTTGAARVEPPVNSTAWADVDGYLPHVALDHRRVLAECEARRRILELAGDGPRHEWVSTLTIETVLRALALPYANHPDYRQEWKP